jgi:membrane dipeptidase
MRYLLLPIFLATGACSIAMSRSTPSQTAPAQAGVSDHALRVYRDAVVIDTHNDMPSKMLDDGYDADVRHQPGFAKSEGETDFPRLVESGVTAQFLSAFVDAEFAFEKPDQSFARVSAYVDTIHAFVDRHPDRLIFATTAADVRRAKETGHVAVLIGVEGGHAIENSIEKLRDLHRRGVRYMTLTWNNGNDWAGSSIGVNGTRTGGLTEFGKQVVREMNRLGMLVDISHVSDATFFDAVATSTQPVIASHSSARALDPAPRNMSDDQLRAVGKNGGVVNVNFYSSFIDPRFLAAKDSVERRGARDLAVELKRPGADSAALRRRFADRTDVLVQQIPAPRLSVLIDHIDHIAKVAGIDHVGLGSDFDGVGGFLPAGMTQVTDLPRIAQALIARGYSDDDIRKILGGNMLRVMQQVLDRRAAPNS